MSDAAWTPHLKSDDLFDVATYPTITFHADGLVFNGAKVIGATGTITMKGGHQSRRLSGARLSV
ncbi:MAG: YceI family protein [Thiohalocapsa sp.]|uniref:YceI family protein n=1 Tax=Thiohalocapsa sp. TaxID=2497641 RepID=UPI00345C207D|nr:YceI family protein [Thiohalocapsa sp.]